MGRLKTLATRLNAPLPRLSFGQRDDHGHSKSAEPWRAWYHLARWKRLRLKVFERDLFTCQREGCGRIEPNTAKLVCDHIEPHRGNPILFWLITNLQTLCKSCHDTVKQAEEHRSRHGPTG